MLIARAPVRISFAGGGTDLEAYYREHGGLVVSTSIDKYFYVFVNLSAGDAIQITSSDYRTFFRQRPDEPILWDGDLALPRAFLHEFGIEKGISIFLCSEIPPGTGLGSSSTVSVALTKALGTLCNLELTPYQLAEFASYVEIEKLGMPIGRQDQYAAAFGGLNVITFTRHGATVEPLDLPLEVETTLDHRMMLFYTGASRSAANILKDQQAASREGGDAVERLHRIKAMARRAVALFRTGDLDGFGALLHESWQEKKRLASGISNARIDDAYEAAREAGAIGGKIAGAGGGGFLLIYAREEAQPQVRQALEERGLVQMDFHFERGGATAVMDAVPRYRPFGRAPRALAELALVPGR